MASATHNTAVQSAAATAAGEIVSHYSIRSTLTGAGRIITRRALSSDGAALTLGQRYEFEADEFVITLPAGEFLADGAEYTLEQLLTDDVYVSLHTSNSESDEATYSGYARITLDSANWTFAE